MNFRKKKVGAALVGVLLLAACGADSNSGATTPSTVVTPTTAAGGGSDTSTASAPLDDIVIGVIAPVTGGGAGIGVAGLLGVRYAQEVINASGGIGGRQVQLAIGDSQGDPTQAVNEVRRLIDREGIEALIGPAYSQNTLAVLPLLTDEKIFSVNLTGTSALTPQTAVYSLSLLANAETNILKQIDVAKGLGAQRIALIADVGAQAESAIEYAKEYLPAEGMELAIVERYPYDVTDMTPQMLNIRRAGVDAILAFTSSGDHSGYVLQARKQLGMDTPVVGSYAFSFADQAAKVAGEDAFNGVTGLNYTPFTYCPGASASEETAEFLEAVEAFDADSFSRVDLNYVALWFDAFWVIKQAIEANDGSTDGETLTNWSYTNTLNSDVGLNRNLSASAKSHFLVGLSSLEVVLPLERLAGGIQQRQSC